MAKQQQGELAALDSWANCNNFLRKAGEVKAAELLKREQGSKNRLQYLLRIHGRFNKMRGQRERSELLRSGNK